jgi:hypothetical protein
MHLIRSQDYWLVVHPQSQTASRRILARSDVTGSAVETDVAEAVRLLGGNSR